MEITVDQVKRQLNIEDSYTGDTAILQHFIDVAVQAVENYCGASALSGYTGSTTPTPIIQATIMLASHFYLNRNMVGFATATEVPYSFQWLLNPYKNIIIV